MQFEIRGQKVSLTPEIIDRAERRVRFALTRFAPRLRSVTVRIDDVNGSRGGEEKRCRVVVCLNPAGELRVEDTAANVEMAIDRAADRAQRSVARAVERERRARGAA